LRAYHIQFWHACETLSGFVIYFMVVFGPWAFGTTEPWSIWTMNACGFGLGLLLLVKLGIQRITGYRSPRWGDDANRPETFLKESAGLRTRGRGRVLRQDRFTWILALLTLLILGYCLVAAVNWRATFNVASMVFEYHPCIKWLPHSLESRSTRAAFCNYLALACSFWAIRDWFSGKTTAERRGGMSVRPDKRGIQRLPLRLKRLCYLLAINGGLLGLAGIAQRLAHSPRLLFVVLPEIHLSAEEQFASYAYRANGAQYFNLLWPVCLGFWWSIDRSGVVKRRPLLMTCIAIMVACPILSNARAAVLTDFAMLCATALVLLFASVFPQRHTHTMMSSVIPLIVLVTFFLALGLAHEGKTLRFRMSEIVRDLEERNQLYERGRLMARDYPLFGTGPGTFERVFQLYRRTPHDYWPTQLHNDWLETRITFGWIGTGLIAIAFTTVILRWFARGGIQTGAPFVILVWIALAGCLVQARWDFPLQVYSILFQFVVWGGVLSTVTRQR
jgi:O-antigen ligase